LSAKEDGQVDHIELRRDARTNFSIWGNKYGRDPITGRLRWRDWHKVKGIRSPLAVKRALDETAQHLNVSIQWPDALLLIAGIDWVTASVIASTEGYALPALPTTEILATQRSLRTLGNVTLGAEWGYDMHELSISFERWIRILGGESCSIDEPYWYEGEQFTGTWSFDDGGLLDVSYEDGGAGWSGKLGQLDSIDGPKIDGIDLTHTALRAVPSAT
jgi:hypothetical protein